MSDLVAFGETMLRLSPPGRERIESATEFEVRAGGAESNAAVAAERLGAVATWTSKLPDSPPGRRVANELRGYGIDVDVVWSDEGRQGVYYLEIGAAPRGTNVVYDRERSAVATATAGEFDLEAIRNARTFFTTGITPALSSTLRETTKNLLGVAHSAGTTTAMDVNYRRKLWPPARARNVLTELFPGVDVLVIAERDARTVLEVDGDPSRIAHALASRFDFATVVVTRGENGALAWNDNVVHDQGAFETDTVDPIGSGDAFTGAFLARRLCGDDVPRALEYAAATAALARTVPGDVARVTKDEVDAVVSDRHADISR